MSLPDLGDVHLDHIAVATKDLERSVSIFTKLGLNFSSEREVVDDQKVKTAFAKIDERANLELLEPLNNDGPIQKFIEKKVRGSTTYASMSKMSTHPLKNSKLKGLYLFMKNLELVPTSVS